MGQQQQECFVPRPSLLNCQQYQHSSLAGGGALTAAPMVVRARTLCVPPTCRRLWESGVEASGQPVVGVVGAGHIKVRGVCTCVCASTSCICIGACCSHVLQPCCGGRLHARGFTSSTWLPSRAGALLPSMVLVASPFTPKLGCCHAGHPEVLDLCWHPSSRGAGG